MTASGDQTTRIHALDGSTPTLLATLRGHTSSIKSSIFYDPTRGSGDASKGSVVATAGRDGNILIYDLRCSGRRLGDGAVTDEYDARRNGRERDRYSAGIPGFTPRREGEEVDPVMVIRGAHAESGRRSNSVCLLVHHRSRFGNIADLEADPCEVGDEPDCSAGYAGHTRVWRDSGRVRVFSVSIGLC